MRLECITFATIRLFSPFFAGNTTKRDIYTPAQATQPPKDSARNSSDTQNDRNHMQRAWICAPPCAHNFTTKSSETTIFVVRKWVGHPSSSWVDNLVALEPAEAGQPINSQASIYIYIYIYACASQRICVFSAQLQKENNQKHRRNHQIAIQRESR